MKHFVAVSSSHWKVCRQHKLLQSWKNATTKGSAEIRQVYKEQWQPTTTVSGKLVCLETKIHYGTTTTKIPKRPKITYTQELQLVAKALRLISEMSEMQPESSQTSYSGSVIQSQVPARLRTGASSSHQRLHSSLLSQILNYPKSKPRNYSS